jgi:Tol biopolymer transport system component
MHGHRLAARRQVTAGLAWAMGVAFTGCGKDESTGPTTGSIAVITTTTGNNLDPDGYTVSVDGGASQAIGINETQTISEVSGGSHSVELGGVAANCTVEGPHPRTVSVAGGAKSQVGFLVRCFTPPPGTIAFETNRTGDFEVFKMNADGTNPVNLTNNAASDTEPDWSPDGTKVAFVSDRNGNNEIYVMNADGSGQTRLTTNSESETGPEWSPDGTKIAFETHREVYVMNADGSGQVNLTSNAAFDGHPAWSSDGTKIAFHTSRTGDIGDYFIYVMNPDGSNPVELSGILARSDRGPAWSPEGLRIAFARSQGGSSEIFVMYSDGSGETRLTRETGADSDPEWSPDGAYLAFQSDRAGNIEVFIMGSDGSRPVNFTNNAATDSHPTWTGTGP